MTLEAIKYKNGKLELLDQLKLPHESIYIKIECIDDGWKAIHQMNVRGAPAIAIAGVLTVAVEVFNKTFTSIDEIIKFTNESMDYLITARPTAVNIADAGQKLKQFLVNLKVNVTDLFQFKNDLLIEMENMLAEDIETNKSLGNHGAIDILKKWSANNNDNSKVKVLTHCNTGSLATAGYGTALGVIRKLNELEKLEHAYCTETRPYNQGSRLTAYELVYEKIPATLICDDMAACLMSKNKLGAVVVGADRVVSNGDTANKIGTYQLAILASHFNVPFYVAVPSTTVDFTMKTGSEIVIEQRPHKEMTHVKDIKIAADGINCWNPSFDVTPSNLITGGLITEHGVFKADELYKLKEILNAKAH